MPAIPTGPKLTKPAPMPSIPQQPKPGPVPLPAPPPKHDVKPAPLLRQRPVPGDMMHSLNVIDTLVRMFRVMGRDRPNLRDGLECAASLAELYREVVEPSGALAKEKLDPKKIETVADIIREPFEVPIYRPRDHVGMKDVPAHKSQEERDAFLKSINFELPKRPPQSDKHRGVTPRPRAGAVKQFNVSGVVYDSKYFQTKGSKTAAIAQRILDIRRAGREMFEKRLVLLRENESKLDLNNAIYKLEGLHYIRNGSVPGCFDFLIEVPPEQRMPGHDDDCPSQQTLKPGPCTCVHKENAPQDDISGIYGGP